MAELKEWNKWVRLAWQKLRECDSTIPDDVLDTMRDRLIAVGPEATPAGHFSFDLALSADESATLICMVVGDIGDEASAIRLHIADGHSGYGLYVSCPEYPEEGAELVRAIQRPESPVECRAAATPERDEQLAAELLAIIDKAVAGELPCVSEVPHNSNAICKWFAANVRERIAAALGACEVCKGTGGVTSFMNGRDSTHPCPRGCDPRESSTNPACSPHAELPITPEMTLRDQLAMRAPIDFAMAVKVYGCEPNLCRDDERLPFFAVWTLLRYEYADAMLNERGRA